MSDRHDRYPTNVFSLFLISLRGKLGPQIGGRFIQRLTGREWFSRMSQLSDAPAQCPLLRGVLTRSEYSSSHSVISLKPHIDRRSAPSIPILQMSKLRKVKAKAWVACSHTAGNH